MILCFFFRLWWGIPWPVNAMEIFLGEGWYDYYFYQWWALHARDSDFARFRLKGLLNTWVWIFSLLEVVSMSFIDPCNWCTQLLSIQRLLTFSLLWSLGKHFDVYLLGEDKRILTPTTIWTATSHNMLLILIEFEGLLLTKSTTMDRVSQCFRWRWQWFIFFCRLHNIHCIWCKHQQHGDRYCWFSSLVYLPSTR